MPIRLVDHCGAAPGRRGPFVPRRLSRSDLRRAIDRLAATPAAARATLPGISVPIKFWIPNLRQEPSELSDAVPS
jgi:hypothetical protein